MKAAVLASALVAMGPMGAMGATGAMASTRAGAAPAGAAVARVHSSVEEARACAPLASGGALVGTAGGLVRLDATGVIVDVWTASDGLPGTRVEAIRDTSDGVLWIGTDNGVAKLDAATFKVVTSQRGRSIRDVLTFGGVTYLATWSGGVRRLVATTATSAAANDSVEVPLKSGKWSGPRAQVSSLAVVSGALYAGTAAGLLQLVDGKFVPVAVTRPELDESAPLAAPLSIASLYGDADTLWIASAEGLYARRPDGVVRSFGGGDLRRVTSLDGAIVVAGVVEGVQRVERGRLVAFPGAPRQLVVAQALGSRGKALCAGGLDGTWLRGDETAAWIAAARREGPPSNDLSALAADGERLWVGTFDRGVALLERGGWRALAHPELDARVNALLVERRPQKPSRLWVATANGLSLIEPGADGSFLAPSVRRLSRADGLPGRGVLALALLADGRLLAGTSYGAVLVDAREVREGASLPRPIRLGAKNPDGSSLGNVWAVAQTSDGAVWLGTTTGLYRGSAAAAREPGRDEAWLRFSLASGHLEDDWVTALVPRGQEILAGTYKGGVVAIALAPPASTTAVVATPAVSAAANSAPVAAFRSARLRAGWINPGGLALDGDSLLAATMDGLFVDASATAAPGLPGVDVTATARIGATRYVATRRGLAELR